MKTKSIKPLGLLAGTALLASLPFSGVAQSILYNLDANSGTSPTYTGAAILGSSSTDLWNSYVAGNYVGSPTYLSLMDSTGSTAAGVHFAIWNNVGTYDNSGGTTANPMGLMEDYINAAAAGDGWPIKVEINNLPTSTAYQLVVYSAGDTAGQGGTISLATDSTFSTIIQSANTTAASRDLSAGPGVAYQSFSGITSAGGTVDFEVANTSDWHALNGFQLQMATVPEPSPLALCGVGLALLTLMRRKK